MTPAGGELAAVGAVWVAVQLIFVFVPLLVDLVGRHPPQEGTRGQAGGLAIPEQDQCEE